MAALMMLLLPTLLLAMSPQKLTGLPLSVPGPSEDLPPLPPGPIEVADPAIERLRSHPHRSNPCHRCARKYRRHRNQTMANRRRRRYPPDFTPPQEPDPERTRLRLIPAQESTTADVVYWMDLVRSDKEGELYRNVVVDSQ